MSDLFDIQNLFHAWQTFASGKKKRNDVAEFSLRLIDNLAQLSRDLRSDQYIHGPYKHRVITDPKRRDIYKAIVRDRIVHQAVHAQLYERFDRLFIHDSYSCRIGKGHHRALKRFAQFGRRAGANNTRPVWALTGDISCCFASVSHRTLRELLRRKVDDTSLFALIEKIISSFETTDRPDVGIPLGNVTSQLFVNVYLNELDQYVKRTLHARQYIRYCDDFVILSDSQEFLESCLARIEDFLKLHLDLLLNPVRVSVRRLSSGVDFLGWVHFPDHRVLRASTRRRMCAALRADATPDVMNSYIGLLTHGNAYDLRQRLLQ